MLRKQLLVEGDLVISPLTLSLANRESGSWHAARSDCDGDGSIVTLVGACASFLLLKL